jgi:hypothetical protein
MALDFVYENVDNLKDKPVFGNGNCPLLIQNVLPNIGQAKTWKEGPQVVANHTIRKGTAIATFVNGVYPNTNTGNHVAFFVEHSPHGGIVIIEQFSGLTHIQRRTLRRKGQFDNGNYVDPSNNADAFSIIRK